MNWMVFCNMRDTLSRFFIRRRSTISQLHFKSGGNPRLGRFSSVVRFKCASGSMILYPDLWGHPFLLSFSRIDRKP